MHGKAGVHKLPSVFSSGCTSTTFSSKLLSSGFKSRANINLMVHPVPSLQCNMSELPIKTHTPVTALLHSCSHTSLHASARASLHASAHAPSHASSRTLPPSRGRSKAPFRGRSTPPFRGLSLPSFRGHSTPPFRGHLSPPSRGWTRFRVGKDRGEYPRQNQPFVCI